MFQSHVFFKDYSYNSGLGERNLSSRSKSRIRESKTANSLALAEGEGVTATSLGQRRSSGGKYIKPRSLKIIHRVPSVEGATATSLSNHSLTSQLNKYKEEIEKTPRMGYLIVVTRQTKRIAHGA